MAVVALVLPALVGSPAYASAIPSYSCVFTEPFVVIDSFPGGIRYTTPEAVLTATGAAASTSTEAKAILGGEVKTGPFSVTIAKKPGTDGMSSLIRPYVATLTAKPAINVTGACLRYPDGTAPRKVAIRSGKLNVRTKASVSSAKLAQLSAGVSVWAFPEKVSNGWVHVAAGKYPAGGDGAITVVEGYVPDEFLAR